jgi:AbiU2
LKLEELKTTDIIAPTHIAAYELEVGTIANEVTNFNANLYLMQKVFNFPWDLILDDYGPFWEYVEKALFDSVILSIWKLCIDTEARGLTLSKLKNNILRDYIKAEFRDEFNARVKAADYNAKLAAVQGVYTEIRHNYVAHFNFMKNAKPTADEIKARQLDLKVIFDTRDLINTMYQVLSLDRYAFLPVQYYPDSMNLAVGGPPGTDIDKLLDLIAQNSEIVNMPERQADYWPIFKESRPPKEIEFILAMRKKFGMPAA